MTTLRNIPQLPRPVDFIDKEGKFSLVGYSYLNELENAVDDIRSLSSTVEGSVEANAAAIAEIQESLNAEVQTGILLQRTEKSSWSSTYGSTSSGAVTGGVATSPIASVTISPLGLSNRIWVHGCVFHRPTAGGGGGADGVIVAAQAALTGSGPAVAFNWFADQAACTPFSVSALTSEWLAFAGLAPSVLRSFDIDLWAVCATEYRIGGSSYLYAEEVTV